MKTLAAISIVAVVAVSGCDKPAAPDVACTPPAPVRPADPDSYAGQRDLARYCIKQAAYEFARKGLPVAEVAASASQQCAPHEEATIAALRRTGPVYPYQRKEVDDDLAHLAQIAAVQARSRGCGIAGPQSLP
jgi:hypothetical protein